jgi:parvulin-like peptidyl-prolyl isomerase
MTSRSTTARRSNRPGRDTRNRHNLYVNLAFGLVILVGVITLIGAAVSTYAGAHFTEVAKVNDQSISQDTLNNRALVDTFRVNAAEAQIRDQNNLGRLTDQEAQTRLSVLEQQRQSLSSTALDRLIDATLQGQLATKEGIAISDAQVDQRLVDEATQKEQRHVSMITVQPEVTTGATAPTDAQKAAAKAAADKALADIKGGKTFEEVAKAVSKDAYAAAGGDAGWIMADDTTIDPALVTALFAAPQGGLTDVVAGSDGSYLIGRVAEVAPASVDPDWTAKIKDAGVPMDAYRDAVRADLVRDELTKKVTADATEQPSVQRQVSEIFVSGSSYQGPGDEVKVRHILYTPGDKAPDAQNPVASDDPGWATAQAKAQATYDKLKALVGKPEELAAEFAAIAKTDSLDTASGANGGELDWFSQSSLDASFGDAVFKDGLKAGDLLEPVKSQFGWHVVLFEGRRGPPEGRIITLQSEANAAGADFAALAKANSDGPEAAKGGDLGWVAPYQLDPAREKAIFAAPIGKVSDPLKTDSGFYLFLVRGEQSRMPDGDQLTTLKSSAFDNWYAAQKAAATITPDLSAGSS